MIEEVYTNILEIFRMMDVSYGNIEEGVSCDILSHDIIF